MSSQGINANLNIIRHYSFKFFTITGGGTTPGPIYSQLPFTITPNPTASIQDSVNFTFNYSIVNMNSNTAQFTFYNLSQASSAMFTSKNARIGFYFNAWYGDNTKGNTTIFMGSTSLANTYRNGPDVLTEVTASDLLTSIVSVNFVMGFPPNTSYLNIINTLLKTYGPILTLDQGSIQYLSGLTYSYPKTCKGSLNSILTKIVFGNRLESESIFGGCADTFEELQI